MDTTRFIRGCLLFERLDDASVEMLAASARTRAYEPGAHVFMEGDQAEALYIVGSGTVELMKSDRSGREKQVRRVGPGQMFAEAALFSGETYPATAVARTKAELIVITKEGFRSLVTKHPEIALAIIGTMADLLRHLNAKLASTALESADKRLASFIMRRQKEDGRSDVHLGLPKKELARTLGVTPETLSRALAKLRDRGIIAVAGRSIIIHKIEELRAIADA
jgi:CRP-like cAMP-binding protein